MTLLADAILNEDAILKLLGGSGTLGIFVWFLVKATALIRDFLKDQQKTFTDAIKENAADLKQCTVELKGSVDALRTTLVEVDRGHTQQNRDLFLRVFDLNDKQGATIVSVTQEVKHLDERVGKLEARVEDVAEKMGQTHGKLDAIARSLEDRPPRRTPPAGPREEPKS